VDTYDWTAGQPGVLEVWGGQHGLSRPSRFLGWLGGDPFFLIVRWDEAQTQDDAEALDRVFQAGGVLRVSFAGQALPPSEGKLTLLEHVPNAERLPGISPTAKGGGPSVEAGTLVVWVRSDLRWGSMLDEVLS
jgi:hypothetical protein